MMTYQETIDYLFGRLPMYQREGKSAYKADLNNTFALCDVLNNPQNSFKSIHVAGTNGKGSTCHILASILQEAGYKTGLYTSPHLLDFKERIKINGKAISENDVVQFIEKNKVAFESIDLSFFEMTVGMAFHHFSKEKVDVAIIETGLGGRLDSTNIVNPELSVITNIGMDHMQFLGNTIEKIAMEKAGIIKPHTPVIIGETQIETTPIFSQFAKQNEANITFADQVPDLPAIPTDLRGQYQYKNVRTALCTIRSLQYLKWKISSTAIQNGCTRVIENTGLRGRWETLSNSPLIICDTAHNVNGIQEVIAQFRSISFSQLHFVLGMVNDKEEDIILKLLPKDAIYYYCKASINRALPTKTLEEAAIRNGLYGSSFSSVREAILAAQGAAKKNDFIYIGGSTFVVAEALEIF